jgi:hypothetical protein
LFEVFVFGMSWVSVAQLIDRVLFEVFVIGVSWFSMAQLIDRVLFEVFVIDVSCVSTAQLRTAQLTDRSVCSTVYCNVAALQYGTADNSTADRPLCLQYRIL